MLISTPKLVSESVQKMIVENGDFIVEVGRSGVITIKSKRTCAEATIAPIPLGMVIAGRGNGGEIHQALTRTHEYFILERTKLYGV